MEGMTLLNKPKLMHALYLALQGTDRGSQGWEDVKALIKQLEGTDKLVYVQDCR